MARFAGPRTTFYWSAIVTIALSCAVLELTLINIVTLKCRLEVTCTHVSRLLNMVPFESLGAVSYWPSVITMPVTVAVCEIFSVKEWCDHENRFRVRSKSLEVAWSQLETTPW